MKNICDLLGSDKLPSFSLIETAGGHSLPPRYTDIDQTPRHGGGANAIDLRGVLGD
jgi:hypothetical protein